MLWTGTPADEAKIAAYEKLHGIAIPSDYRSFLTATNGGVPIHCVAARESAAVVARLFELGARADEADLWNAQVRYAARVPPTLMPIGVSTSGNVLCIGLFGVTRGRVFSHDLDGPAAEVATSFTELLAIFSDRDPATTGCE